MDYILEEIPRGQLNNVILTTMLDGDKYGYEIIAEILNWSNGKIDLKQPSLYSALTRLEKADMLSSYWTDSDIGGKRHYYRLTDLGRKTATAWAENFMQERSETDKAEKTPPKEEIKEQERVEEKKDGFTILDQGNLFQLINKEPEVKEETKTKTEEINEFQFNLFDQIPAKKEIKEAKIEKAARIANENSTLVQLKQYSENDRKSEFEKLKQNKTSFFESDESVKGSVLEAPAKSAADPTPSYTFIKNKSVENNIPELKIDGQKENIETFEKINVEKFEDKIEGTFNISKYASARDGYFLDPNHTLEEPKTSEDTKENEQPLAKEYVKPDAIFLNEYERIEHLPEVKKIEPMNLNIEFAHPSETITFKKNYDNDFSISKNKRESEPAPSENSAKTKHTLSRPSFSSYLGLKNYYTHLGIGFKEYKQVDKNEVVDKKQIWLVNFLRCGLLLAISIILAFALNFGIKGNLYGRIAFVVFPILIAIVDIVYLILYDNAKRNPKTKIKVLNLKSMVHSLIAATCLIIVVVAINLMLGLGSVKVSFIPTLVYPIVLLIIAGFAPLINKLISKILVKIKK